MVGWAHGPIDKDEQVSKAFMDLQMQAKIKYEATNDKYLAIYHDALGILLAAIFQHDEDLKPSIVNDDDGVEM